MKHLAAALLMILVGCSRAKDERIAHLELQLSLKDAELQLAAAKVKSLETKVDLSEAKIRNLEYAQLALHRLQTPAALAEKPWIPATQAIEIDGVRIKVLSVGVQTVYTKGYPDGPSVSVDPEFGLLVTLEIENLTKQRKLDFSGWSANQQAKLIDDAGNVYKQPPARIVVGQFLRSAIYPEETVLDVVAFQLPVASMKYLHLLLPGENVNASNDFRFEIPASMIRGL